MSGNPFRRTSGGGTTTSTFCKGADDDFHVIVTEQRLKTIGHPGVNQWGKCPTRGKAVCDEMLPAKPFLDRDRDIVNACDVLVATPKGFGACMDKLIPHP